MSDRFLQQRIIIKFWCQIITGDETWCFQYDPESNGRSLQWKQPKFPRPKKACMLKLQMNAMLITFLDIVRIVHLEFISQGQSTSLIMWKY
jgi:hypothetical protein